MPSQDHGDTTAERANTIARLIEVFNDTEDRKLRKELRGLVALMLEQIDPPVKARKAAVLTLASPEEGKVP
jgi:hypothetical protein